MISHLTVNDLEKAVSSKRKVIWHPEYQRIKRKNNNPFNIVKVQQEDSEWGIFVKDLLDPPWFITEDGLGIDSLLPVFAWAENEIQITDGKCHCASPKPIMLLVRTICDNCGNEMSTASQT